MSPLELISFVLIAIQIITESLPISSSAHVSIALLLFGKANYIFDASTVYPPFLDDFLHGPASLITLIFFRKRWWFLVKQLFVSSLILAKNNFHRNSLRDTQRQSFLLCIRLITLFCISSCGFLLFYAIINHEKKMFLTDNNQIIILFFGLLITTALLLSQRWIKHDTYKSLTRDKALILGLTQGCAMFLPGLSRLGSTLIVGMWLGLSPRRSFEWSMIMIFPYTAAAFLIRGLPAIISQAHNWLSPAHIILFLGATIISYACFAWCYRLAQRHTLWALGIYMIIPLTILVLHFLG